MKLMLPIIFNQKDSRWANKLLGFNTNAAFNFYNYACLISCLAMVARYYGFDETPATINDKLKALPPGQGFGAGTGNYAWGGLTRLFSSIKEGSVATPQALTDAQINQIKTSLDTGYPVMIHIDVNPKSVENDQHWVLITGYNPNDENDFTIADPLTGTERSLKDYLGWFRPSARATIEKYVIYSGKAPTQTVAVPADIYPDIIHGSTQWDRSSAEYMPDSNPKQTNFEALQKVVNGYKSDATKAKNDLREVENKLSESQTEVVNQKDKVANITKDCQEQLKLKEVEISTLKASVPNIDKLTAQYEGTINALRADLRESQKQGGLKDIENAKLKTELAQALEGVVISPADKLLSFLNDLWQKLKSVKLNNK